MEEFAGVYADLSKLVGRDNTIKIYQYFRGQQVSFPIRLYSVEFVADYIRSNYDGTNLNELSRKFGYTERRIRQFLKEEKIQESVVAELYEREENDSVDVLDKLGT